MFTWVAVMSEATNVGHRETAGTNDRALTLVRFHLHDWVILFGLLILDRVLANIRPFHRFVGEFSLDNIRYPLKGNTVPFWAVPIISVIFPLIFIVSTYIRRKDPRDLHHATLGLLFSVLLSATVTDAVKDLVGRPRPDFFWRCFPDGHAIFNNITGEVVCHGNRKAIEEGHRSFPSGHTSWCFAGLGFVSLYLAGKIRLFDRKGHVSKLVIVFSPLAVASFVGLSRVNDYKHHWQDVFAGALLGLTTATLCYRQFFPAPHDDNCMHPYTIFPISGTENSSTRNQQPPFHSPLLTNNTVADTEMGRIEHASDERLAS